MLATAPVSQDNERLRRVRHRDGSDCVWCGSALSVKQMRLDLLVARVPDSCGAANQVISCPKCARLRQGQPVDRWTGRCEQRGHVPNREAVVRSLLKLLDNCPRYRRAEVRKMLWGMGHQEILPLSNTGLVRYNRMSRLMERDGSDCVWCGCALAPDHPEASFEHLMPKTLGGPDQLINLTAACRACNNHRHHASVTEWVAHSEAQGWRVDLERIMTRLEELSRCSQKRVSNWSQLQMTQLNRYLIA